MVTMSTLLAIAIGLAVVLNLYATYVILGSPSFTAARKAMQVLITWLVPVLGAIVCIIFSSTDTLPSPAAKPQEFYENVDSSGSDH
jgi:hypothetical protein